MSRFKKTKENFICENCGMEVKGTGYTNHCPACLWSKHVDITPGDRQEKCWGLMKPIGGGKKGKSYYIIQKCIKCGFERKNKLQKNDNFDKFVEITSNQDQSYQTRAQAQ